MTTAVLETSSRQTARRSGWPGVIVLAFAAATAVLQQATVIPLLPQIQRELGVSLAAATWVLTVNLLVGGVATLLLSRFGDLYGKRRLVLGTLGLLIAGSVLAALAPTLPLLIAGRVLQGMSAALVPLAIGVARDVLPRAQVPTAIGMISATMGTGFGTGLIISGTLAGAGRQTVFWLCAALTALVAVAVAALVRDTTPTTPSRPDILGALLLTAGLVCLLLGISQGRSWGWTSPAVLGLLAAALVIGAIWVAVERRSAAPLIDLSMLTDRGTVGATLISLLLGYAMFGILTTFSPFAQTPPAAGYGFGASTLQVGLFLLPMTGVMLLFSLLSGPLQRRFAASSMVAMGSAVVAVGSLWLVVRHDLVADVYGASTVLGLGMGVAFAALGTMAIEHVAPDETAVASGINSLVRILGGAVAGAVVGVLLSPGTGGTLPSIGAYQWSFALAAGGAAIAAILAVVFGALNRRAAQRDRAAV